MSIFRPYPVLRQVIVVSKTGQSFKGVIWSKRGGHIVLKNAQILQDGGMRTPMDGELLIERANVDFIQVLPS